VNLIFISIRDELNIILASFSIVLLIYFSVHVYRQKIIEEVLSRGIKVNKIKYYSDGCAAQYKNCKNMLGKSSCRTIVPRFNPS
jgi:hypothetical protein